MAEEKILQDEILSDEQLDGVAGGSEAQSRMDTKFLREINAMQTNDGTHADKPADLIRAWATMGVTFIEREEDYISNKYFNNGKQISRIDALRLAAKKMKSKINVLDYDI